MKPSKNAPAAAQAAEAPAPELVSVVLSHSAFGSHAFRTTGENLADEITRELAAAHRAAERRRSIAAIDAKQNDLLAQIRTHEREVAAAKILRDTHAQRRLEDAIATKYSEINALGVHRTEILAQ